jgi:hypothetical protein
VLAPVVEAGVFPEDVAAAVTRSLENPAAATCSDRHLLLALARYDRPHVGRVRVEEQEPMAQGGQVQVPGPVLILPGRAVGADGAFNELNPRHITSCRPNGPTPKVAGRCWVPSTPTGTVVLRRCACLIRRLASLLDGVRLTHVALDPSE